MCQAAPLGRCSNHSDKDIEKTEKEIKKSKEEVSYYNNEYIKEVEKAKEKFSYSDEEIARSHEDDALSGVTTNRNKRDFQKREVQRLEAELKVLELHYDASPKGMKALEASDGHRDASRLQNAQNLKKWQEELKDYRDENNVRIVDKGANKDQKQALYYVESERAKSDYKNSIANIEAMKQRLGRVRKEIAEGPFVDEDHSRKLAKLEQSHESKLEVFKQMSVLSQAKIGLLNKAMAPLNKNAKNATMAQKFVDNQKLLQESRKLTKDNGQFTQKVSGIFANQAASAGNTYFREANSKKSNPLKTEVLASRARVYEETSSQFDSLLKEKSPAAAVKAMSKLATQKKVEEMSTLLATKNRTGTEVARAKAQAYEHIIQLLKGTSNSR